MLKVENCIAQKFFFFFLPSKQQRGKNEKDLLDHTYSLTFRVN